MYYIPVALRTQISEEYMASDSEMSEDFSPKHTLYILYGSGYYGFPRPNLGPSQPDIMCSVD